MGEAAKAPEELESGSTGSFTPNLSPSQNG
jgi:hypothetical protein